MKFLKLFNKYMSTLSIKLGTSKNWQTAFKSSRSMVGYLNRLPILLLGRSGRTWIFGILHFAKFALSVRGQQGTKGLAILLKSSHVALMKAAAGDRLENSWSLGAPVALTGSGYPRLIPSIHRKEIRRGNATVIRFWLSILSLYRVINYQGQIKISTITAPGKDFNILPYLAFVHEFFGALNFPEKEKLIPSPMMISKSGPGSRSKPYELYAKSNNPLSIEIGNNTAALALQAAVWLSPKFKELLWVLQKYCTLTGATSMFNSLKSIGSEINGMTDSRGKLILGRLYPKYLGKLGFKDEPGKVRVFAMVDWWTQVFMNPFHKYLFSILARIEQDGTMDQDRAVALGRHYLWRKGEAYSFDITAATDRIPVLVQALLVNYLLPGCGQLWSELLVGRAYSLRISNPAHYARGLPKTVRYAVGQPMGALSSWAMLALTHHFIVQLAARRAGHYGWFPFYLVLGDDLVIFDKQVAKEYLIIMEDLGVGIGLAKSLQSKSCFEFAKRYIYRGKDLPIVSFKEMDVAMSSLDALLMLLHRHRGNDWRIADVMKLKGFGYQALSQLTVRLDLLPSYRRLLIVWLSFPGVSKYSAQDWISWFSLSALGQSDRSLNLQALGDIFKNFIQESEPQGSTSELVPRDIYGPTGLPRVRHWRAENLDAYTSTLLWPLQVGYMNSHREHDALRVRLLGDVCFSTFFCINQSIDRYMQWDAQAALTPVHVDVNKFRLEEVRTIAGRWLKLWARTRSVTTK